MWGLRKGPYGSRGGQDEDDISSFAAVHPPVLWPLQAGDADLAPLQAAHVGAETIDFKSQACK